MTDWAALQHAYGEASDVPELISAAAASGEEYGSAWEDVWSCLCHQGTVYTASYAAIPLLTDVAVRHGPAGYIAALDLAAAIVASTDRPAEGVDVRQQHAQELSLLRDLTERNLALAANDTEFIYGLQALMAFEDGGVWQRELNHLADGELPLECPSCGEFLLLNLNGPEFTLANVSDASVPATPVQPVEPHGDAVGARILALAQAHSRPDVAARIAYVLGRATCPSCATAFEVPTAVS